MTAIVMGTAAEQRVEGKQPFEVSPDVELLGDTHGAMKLNGLFGDKARAFADLGFRTRGRATAAV